METAAKALTDELSRVAKDIVHASHRLQKEFAEAPDVQTADEERPMPDPVKLIRRICALERAMADLTNDCEQIAQRRSKIAPTVIQAQQENVSLVWELSDSFPEIFAAMHSEVTVPVQQGEIQEQSVESEWVLLAEKLNEQAEVFVPRGKIKG